MIKNFRKEILQAGRFGIFKNLFRSTFLSYNAAISAVRQAEADGSAFVIAPSTPLELGRLEKNREKIDAVYLQGKRDARANLTSLIAYLNA